MRNFAKLGVILAAVGLLLFSGPVLSQTKIPGKVPIPKRPGLLLGGLVHLMDKEAPDQDGLEASITLKKNNLPLTGAVVKLNGMVLQEKPGGLYEKDIYPFPISQGKGIKITLKPKPGPSLPMLSEETMATVVIDNMIQYVSPQPNGLVNIGIGRSIPFRWNFVGPVKKSQMRIYDTSNNQIIFQQIVTGTTVNVPANIFRPRNTYRLYQLVYDFDYFRLRQGLSPGSKVELGYAYTMKFQTR